MPTLAAQAGARSCAPSPRNEMSVIAEFPLSPFESFIAAVNIRDDGRRVASISRIKHVNGGLRRQSSFEFSEHHIEAIASLIDEIMRSIAQRNGG